MRGLRRRRRPMTPEENRQRNRQRILNPPKPTLPDRVLSRLWQAEKWWWRHVTHRRLYRALDQLRADWVYLRGHQTRTPTDTGRGRGLDRLQTDWIAQDYPGFPPTPPSTPR